MSTVASLPAHRLSKNPDPGLTPLAEHRLRFRLRLAAPSEPWVDAQFVTVNHTSSTGEVIALRRVDATVFPPGGRRNTAMRWCRRCGRYTPPQCISLIERRRARFGPVVSATLTCDDCRIAHDEEASRELHDALPNLRPLGSVAFVRYRNSKMTKKFS